MKLITFLIPCYNSASYMKKAINSLLRCNAKKEIILVNDGSDDDTLKIAEAYQNKYPKIIKVIDQENKGPGGAINVGLKIAEGKYFKIVDSDDWLEEENLNNILAILKAKNIDVLFTNYVLEKNNGKEEIEYNIPTNKKISWQEITELQKEEFILMHSMIVKTKMLKKGRFELPENTFYVDNLFVFFVLQHMKKIIYLNIPLYHYIIDRDDQTVNKSIMSSKIDDLISVIEQMIKNCNLKNMKNENLKSYLKDYIEFIINVAIKHLEDINTQIANEKKEKLKESWNYKKKE